MDIGAFGRISSPEYDMLNWEFSKFPTSPLPELGIT